MSATEANSSKVKNKKYVQWCIIFIVVGTVAILIAKLSKAFHDNSICICTNSIILISLSLVCLFFSLLALLFGSLNCKLGIFNFLIGDEGTYSLSRLQACLWATTILGYQVAVVIALLFNPNPHSLYYHQAAFSESSIWLLGLSLSSYIAVKGITVNNISEKPKLLVRRSENPKWGDILIGTNGLDFSKCQMLAWTIIALFAFLSKCYYFIYHLQIEPPVKIVDLFQHFYEDYSTANRTDDATCPYVPYLPWTFVVLMGLSQGTYVGKKLVPSFKVDEAKQQLTLNYNDQIAKLNIEIQAKENLLANLKPVSSIGIENMRQLQLSIQELIAQKNGYQSKLNQLQ